MSEDEYMAGEPMDDDDSEILYDFLIEEPDDLTLIMMPKIEFNLEETLEDFYKNIKKCKNKDQLKTVLRQFYAYSVGVTTLQNDIQFLQDRAKELELQIQMMQLG